MPATTEREYRDMPIEPVKPDEGEGDGKKIVRGYATTFGLPYVLWEDQNYIVEEQVDRNAFDGCDLSDVIMQYNHEGRVFARTKNGTLRLTPDDHGLLVEADLGGTDIGRDLYEEIRGGYTDKMSFGFTVAEEKWETVDGADAKEIQRRTIVRIGKLYDVSAVSIPANNMTEISARAIADGAISKAEAERLQRERIEAERNRIIVRAEALGGKHGN